MVCIANVRPAWAKVKKEERKILSLKNMFSKKLSNGRLVSKMYKDYS